MPRTVSSNSSSRLVSFRLCIAALSTAIAPADSARFWAAYLSMAPDGFRRRADRGLSKVDTEDPETREGVRMLGGAAGTVEPEGGTEMLLLEPTVFCATAVTGVAVLVVLLFRLGSGVATLLLERFASLDTCCTGFFCLPPLGATALVGMRLLCFGGCWVVGSSCC